MRISRNFLPCLIFLFACQTGALGQAVIDSLCRILDAKKVPDSTYVKTAVNLCKTVANTDLEYLLPNYAIKGLKTDSSNRDIQSKSALYGYLGNYYWKVGQLSEAAYQFNQMRFIGETSSDTAMISNSLIGLGTVYYLMEEYKQALAYYSEGLALSGTDSLLQVRFFNNIANTFSEENQMDSAISYYNKSISYHKSHQNYRFLSISYGNLALTYKDLHNRQEVKRNITLALEAAIKAKDPYQIASIYEITGDLAIDKHPDLAAQCFKLALEIARKSKSYDQIRKNLEKLANLSDSSGHYKNEIVYLREMKILDDSLDLVQRKARINQMEFDHVVATRNATEVKKAQQEELEAIKDQNRQKNLLIILSIAFIAVMVLFLMGFFYYRLKMKITRTKEKFFSMIAHDIRNPFSGILGLSGLLNEEAEKDGDPVHLKLVRSLHKSLNQVYELLENLLQWSQSETGKISFNPIVQPLSPFVHEVICLHTAIAKQKDISIENQIRSDLTARFDGNMLQTVIRNLLSNSIKFSTEKSSIFISAELQGRRVVVKVRDEGIGMTREQIDRIFKTDAGISTPGTRNETGTGLGLVLCRNFITRHGGKIWAESKPGKGTTVFFTLPG
ncbi:MAG: tetratricopeptide repeat-containing sensor histidine kinase [Bacteroidia bacterium]|nr:tetratricopeptide repeat-containing sensor histidine kinase [Bacteroidia bacterium]